MKAQSFTMHRLATDESARRSVLAAVRAKPNGEIAELETVIARFEKKFAMTSAEAVIRVESGDMPATQEIESWMMAVRVRDDLAALKSAR